MALSLGCLFPIISRLRYCQLIPLKWSNLAGLSSIMLTSIAKKSVFSLCPQMRALAFFRFFISNSTFSHLLLSSLPYIPLRCSETTRWESESRQGSCSTFHSVGDPGNEMLVPKNPCGISNLSPVSSDSLPNIFPNSGGSSASYPVEKEKRLALCCLHFFLLCDLYHSQRFFF